MKKKRTRVAGWLSGLAFCSLALVSARSMYFDRSDISNVITGTAAFTDYKNEHPGVFRKITVADLPKPYATQGVSNSPSLIPKPADAWPKTLPGFKVDLYADGFNQP